MHFNQYFHVTLLTDGTQMALSASAPLYLWQRVIYYAFFFHRNPLSRWCFTWLTTWPTFLTRSLMSRSLWYTILTLWSQSQDPTCYKHSKRWATNTNWSNNIQNNCSVTLRIQELWVFWPKISEFWGGLIELKRLKKFCTNRWQFFSSNKFSLLFSF